MNLPIERFNYVVAETQKIVKRARAHQAECPCPDCKGDNWQSYKHCREFCPAYQEWLKWGEE